LATVIWFGRHRVSSHSVAQSGAGPFTSCDTGEPCLL